jgi:hypothetical protein
MSSFFFEKLLSPGNFTTNCPRAVEKAHPSQTNSILRMHAVTCGWRTKTLPPTYIPTYLDLQACFQIMDIHQRHSTTVQKVPLGPRQDAERESLDFAR